MNHPGSRAERRRPPMASTRRVTTLRANSNTSRKTGNFHASCGTSFSSPTTITNRLLIDATFTFSRVRYPPPPLIRFSSGSTSSAPSMVEVEESIAVVARVPSGDPNLPGDLLSLHARRHTDDLAGLLIHDAFTQGAYKRQRRLARAQADALTGGDELGREEADFFQLFGGGCFHRGG